MNTTFKFVIKDNHNNVIDYCNTPEEGDRLIKAYEDDDIAEGCFYPNFYSIKPNPHYNEQPTGTSES